MTEVALPALDGQEPLGFLAAVGLLELLSELVPAGRPRLRFERDGTGTAVVAVEGHANLESLAELVGRHLSAPAALGELFRSVDLPSGKAAERACAQEVHDRIETLGRDPAHRREREWLRSITSDVPPVPTSRSGAQRTRPKSPSLMTLRNTCLSWQARELAEIMRELMATDPGAVAQALTRGALVRCRTSGEPALASSGWDRGAIASVGRNAVPPPVAVLHEWLAINALPCFTLESDGRRAVGASWYRLDGHEWFVWPLWTPPLGRAAVRYLLRSDLRPAIDRGRPVTRVMPHRDVHTVWASEKTVILRGGPAGQNDPFMGEPVRVRGPR